MLDLGAGTGLLGMIAARAGADVWAVEMSPVLREVAALCAAKNRGQLRGAMTVLPAMVSTQLRVGHELPSQVDMVVSEVLDADVISEGVIASLRHAKEELMVPDGVMIPAAVTIYCQPVECSPLVAAAKSYGVDLTALNQHWCRGYHPIRYETMPHRFLGPACIAQQLDFRDLPRPKPGARMLATSLQLAGHVLQLQVTRAGELTGLAWYFDVHLAGPPWKEASKLSAGPGSAQRTWKQNCRFLQRPRMVAPGDAVEVVMAHDEATIVFELREDVSVNPT